jgi:hypothetical protein
MSSPDWVTDEVRQRYRDAGPGPSIPTLERDFAESQEFSEARRSKSPRKGLMPNTRGEWFDTLVITLIVLGVGAVIMFAVAGLPPYT